MSIKARLKRLEKKIAATEVPMREIGVFAGVPIWRTEERDGVVYCLPLRTSEEYAERCPHSTALLAKCAAFAAEMEETDKAPVHVDMPERPAPGTKRPNFVFIQENGREIQINTRTGERTVI